MKPVGFIRKAVGLRDKSVVGGRTGERLRCFSRRTVTHHGGSSAMRLWLTSRTSSFFASHNQSGRDSMWFLQEDKPLLCRDVFMFF